MPQSISGLYSAADLQPGEHYIDGATIKLIINQDQSAQSGLVALAGGGSVGAPILSQYISEFTTVAHANDSCLLPYALAGAEIEIINSGAQNLRVYAQTANPNNLSSAGLSIADYIVPLGGTPTVTFVTIAPNAIGVFSCTALGRWKSQNQ